ncbi:MAG TPA: TRAFs-binding domain-containing protein [Pyrinomonadaceae bacterium]|nr:TRAFs-binding domain-containing protein [Pyrinomonadaceae bacterium]
MEYKPRPIDTSGVKLPEDVLELTELLARNTHEIWARQRLSEHWHYGAHRDDERREHPGLVSYEELSEVEKQYDRNTALETLKTIISLGYRIEPPARAAALDAALAATTTGDVDAILVALKQPGALNLNDLLAIWQERTPSRWARSAELYQRLGARFSKLGEPYLTYDVTSEGLKFWPDDLRLRQLQALALARAGATAERANALLTAIYEEGQRDEETIGMLARTHKDLWKQAGDPAERERQLQQSYKFYEEAYRLSGGYWTGINAATLALLSGRRDDARELAAEVRALCLKELERAEEKGEDVYWILATLGEAALVSEDWTEAARRYDEAVANAPGRLGDRTSTRRNARLIIEHLGGDTDFIEQHLPMPKVVVYTGFVGADNLRLPPEAEDALRQVIRARLSDLNAGVGYTVVPTSGDASFLEAMVEAGGETHTVLPCQLSELTKTEHTGADGVSPNARITRYESVLARVTSVFTASEQDMTLGNMSSEYSRLLVDGFALIHAKQLDTQLVRLSLLDGRAASEAQPASGEETTERVELIDVSGLLPPRAADAQTMQESLLPASGADADTDFKAHMVALLFADAVNFSKLTEAQIPVFVQHFLGAIGSLVERFSPAPLLRNTWGDGLYLVFPEVQAAGRFALDLSDLLNATDWTELGLPTDLNLRIALHAGPVYACTDPVTKKENFIGTHVSRAARLEPITPPGQVYASQAFAALSAASRVADFTCDYVGQTPLAKKYGTFPTYHVRRQR